MNPAAGNSHTTGTTSNIRTHHRRPKGNHMTIIEHTEG